MQFIYGFPAHLAQLIGEFTAHRTALVIPVQGIDTSASNPASQLQLNILMAVAEFEREIIRERVNSGLRAARARGARFGRRSTLQKYLPRVTALREAGRNVAQIARELMLPYSSAHKLVRRTASQIESARSMVTTCKSFPVQVRKPVFENHDRYGLGPTRDRSSDA